MTVVWCVETYVRPGERFVLMDGEQVIGCEKVTLPLPDDPVAVFYHLVILTPAPAKEEVPDGTEH